MSIPNNTSYPSSIALTISPRPGFWLIIGVFLFSTVLLTGCGSVQKAAQAPAPPAAAATNTPIPTPLPAPAPADPAVEATAVSSSADNSAQDSLPKPELRAKVGKIIFAAEATDQHEPVNPSLLFSQGITQIHAIFDYSDMSPSYTWERIWLLNDKEVSRKSGIWTGPASGKFDYFIDNSGKPLPPGDWVLEIYVEGKLLSLGAFVIEDSGEANVTSSVQ